MRKIGDVVAGRYALAASLGGAVVGPMFRAFDLQASQEVAVKVLEPERCGAEAWQRYAQLVAAATRARSPGLVLPRLQPAGAGEPAHAVSELLVGEDLEALRARVGPVPAERAVEIAAACARALGPVTTATGAAHRDLKPGNLWICADGEVRVLDYGFAELGVQPVPPRAGVYVEYRAPEQLEGAAGDARSDVFSLAVLLFELVTGVHPFAGPSAFKVAHRVLLQAAPRPTEVAPAIPMTAAVEDVFARALAKRPADRFADLSELARSLAHSQRSEVALLPFEDEPPAPAPVAEDLSELVAAPQAATPDDMSTMLILKGGREANAAVLASAPSLAAPAAVPASAPSLAAPAPAAASAPSTPAAPALLAPQVAAQGLAAARLAAPAPAVASPPAALSGPPPLPFGDRTDPDIDPRGLAASARAPSPPRRDAPLFDDGQRTVVGAGPVRRDEPLDATELLPAPGSASDMATHLVQVADDDTPSVTVVAPRPGASSGREATLALAPPTQELAPAESGTVLFVAEPQATLMLDAPGTLMLDAPATTSVRPEPPREPPARSHAATLVAINLVAGLLILGGIAWWVLRG